MNRAKLKEVFSFLIYIGVVMTVTFLVIQYVGQRTGIRGCY